MSHTFSKQRKLSRILPLCNFRIYLLPKYPNHSLSFLILLQQQNECSIRVRTTSSCTVRMYPCKIDMYVFAIFVKFQHGINRCFLSSYFTLLSVIGVNIYILSPFKLLIPPAQYQQNAYLLEQQSYISLLKLYFVHTCAIQISALLNRLFCTSGLIKISFDASSPLYSNYGYKKMVFKI